MEKKRKNNFKTTLKDRTPAERKKIARQGAEAATEVKRRKKKKKETAKEFLEAIGSCACPAEFKKELLKYFPDVENIFDGILKNLFLLVLKGDATARENIDFIKMFFDYSNLKPAGKQEINGNIKTNNELSIDKLKELKKILDADGNGNE